MKMDFICILCVAYVLAKNMFSGEWIQILYDRFNILFLLFSM